MAIPTLISIVIYYKNVSRQLFSLYAFWKPHSAEWEQLPPIVSLVPAKRNLIFLVSSQEKRNSTVSFPEQKNCPS